MTSQFDVMNIVNSTPPSCSDQTWVGMSKFQGSSYRKHWCANCRLPVPSDNVPCPTCGVPSEVMSTERAAAVDSSRSSRSRPEGQSRQPVAGGAHDRGLHLPPIGSSARDVSGKALL